MGIAGWGASLTECAVRGTGAAPRIPHAAGGSVRMHRRPSGRSPRRRQWWI